MLYYVIYTRGANGACMRSGGTTDKGLAHALARLAPSASVFTQCDGVPVAETRFVGGVAQ